MWPRNGRSHDLLEISDLDPYRWTSRRRRRWLLAGAAGLLVLVSVAVVVVVGRSGRPPSPTPEGGVDDRTSPAPPWLSGASGTGVPNGTFAAWRGSPVTIAGTWADSDKGQVELWQLHSGGEYGSWRDSIDLAIGAIDAGESWAQAARGAYDGRWRTSLTNMKSAWGSRPGTLFIRFAHEMNGNWYPWSVNASNYQDFIAGWKRFRALQQEIFPASKLVFCLNRESVGSGIDWRKTFPGAQYVDVLGVDYYNNPVERTLADFRNSSTRTDKYGAPVGIEAFRRYAEQSGLPLAVPEWSGNAESGDLPDFVTGMHEFFQEHAGTGPGQLRYEILFNVPEHSNAQFSLYGATRMPHTARRYQQLW